MSLKNSNNINKVPVDKHMGVYVCVYTFFPLFFLSFLSWSSKFQNTLRFSISKWTVLLYIAPGCLFICFGICVQGLEAIWLYLLVSVSVLRDHIQFLKSNWVSLVQDNTSTISPNLQLYLKNMICWC